MLISYSTWKLRLDNEFQAMQNFPVSNLISWKIEPGQKPPTVKAYRITYHVKTMIRCNGTLRPQLRTEVLITMPENPSDKPTARIVGGAIPYHPNIYPNGDFCIGDFWEKDPRLWHLVIRIGKVLAFSPDCTNPDSPANPAAAADWKQKMCTSSRRKPYPCGRTDFPHPIGY